MPRFYYYSQIAVINQCTVVTDLDGSKMVSALNSLLPKFCNDWSIPVVTAVYIAKGATYIPTNMYYIYLSDNSDSLDALGYHDITSDLPYGKVFAKTILSGGGVLLYESTLKKPTVAQALAHETFELIIDPRCNIWWMNYNTGLLVAAEVADPVEYNVVVVTLLNGTKVGMSDWILPSWQDAQNTTGPFNHLNTITAPFQVKNGYAMTMKSTKVIFIYGETPNPVTNSHSQAGGRSATRVNATINMS
jgi:hypothetical protein